jgi:hypothetical protein
MVKIPSPRRLFRSRSRSTTIIGGGGADICAMVAEHERIEWEVRPGGMLVQKRRSTEDDAAAAVEYILVRVSTTGWQWHDVSIDATATFGTSAVVLLYRIALRCVMPACTPLSLACSICSPHIKLVNGELFAKLRLMMVQQQQPNAGDLKVMLSLATGLWPREQRLLYRGKERDDCEHLHMVGVQDKDKVLLLEDPAVKERKLRSTTLAQLMGVPCHSFIQV